MWICGVTCFHQTDAVLFLRIALNRPDSFCFYSWRPERPNKKLKEKALFRFHLSR